MKNNSGPVEPLPPNLPHIAYIVLWYPLFTQPFIFREVENLRKYLPLQVYSLYGQNLKFCSQEMKNNAMKPETYGAKSFFRLLGSLASSFFKHPKKMFALFRETCLRKWPSLEVFGENFWAFCAGVHLGKRLKEDGIDFIYAPWPRGAATAAFTASKISGLPYALAARGDNLNPADPDLADKFKDAAFIRANNAADLQRIEEFAPRQVCGKTSLIYNSLTLPSPSQNGKKGNRPHKPFKILAVGRFDVTKGFDVLIRACDILKRENFDFHLTLAGGGGKMMGLGNLEQTLLKLRSDLHLENEISMPGLVSHDELPRMLEEHDVFAAPCVVHASGRRDGIPNTVIEAMFYGLPIIASNINALPEIVRPGETGLLIPPDDPQALAKAILLLATESEQREKFGNNAAVLARELFDPETNAKKFANLFIETNNCVKKRVPSCAA